MPFVRVSLSAGRSPEVKKQLAADLKKSLMQRTGCAVSSVWIVFEDIADDDWIIGGSSIAEIKAASRKA